MFEKLEIIIRGRQILVEFCDSTESGEEEYGFYSQNLIENSINTFVDGSIKSNIIYRSV